MQGQTSNFFLLQIKVGRKRSKMQGCAGSKHQCQPTNTVCKQEYGQFLTNDSAHFENVGHIRIKHSSLTVAVDTLDLHNLGAGATLLPIIRNARTQTDQLPVVTSGLVTWHRLHKVWTVSRTSRWLVCNLSFPQFETCSAKTVITTDKLLCVQQALVFSHNHIHKGKIVLILLHYMLKVIFYCIVFIQIM